MTEQLDPDLFEIVAPGSVNEVVERIRLWVHQNQARVFAVIDHAAAADSVGLQMRQESVVLFGSPAVGTTLMEVDARAGLDLPLRALVYESDSGTRVVTRLPRATRGQTVSQRVHDAIERMSAFLRSLLRTLAEPAAAEDTSCSVLPYYRLGIGRTGLTTMEPLVMSGFESRSLGGFASPSWVLDLPGLFQNVSFVLLPIGWIGDWHESPFPQWVVALSGRWFVETQDGTRVEMGPGDLHWGEDQGTRERAGGHGHRSGQLGESPCMLMMVQRTGP